MTGRCYEVRNTFHCRDRLKLSCQARRRAGFAPVQSNYLSKNREFAASALRLRANKNKRELS
jgi:hypothetical protein